MKPTTCAICALLLALVPLGAQELVAPLPEEIPIRPAPEAPLVTPSPKVEGIVAEIFNVRKPWQLINPLAPAEYGTGAKTVSRDPNDPEKPKGFILFAFDW